LQRTLAPLSSLALLSVPLHAQEDLYSVAATEVIHPEVVVGLADLNGDGVSDLAIGTRTIQGLHRVQVHSGRTGALLFDVGAPEGSAFYGHMICPLDDMNADGANDFAVVGSQSGDSHSPPGILDVISGADGSVLTHFDPPSGVVFREFPPAVATGDVDGDGHPDVLIATSHSLPGKPEVQAFSTATGLSPNTASDDPSVSAQALTALNDDYDADGVDDFAVAVIDSGNQTVGVELRSGYTGDLLLTHVIPDLFVGFDGAPIASVPDLDGDGIRDLALSAPFESLVRLISSASGATLLEIPGGGPIFSFGRPILDAGDVDLDGSPDLLITQVEADQLGTVTAYSLLDGHEVFSAQSPEPECCFGFSLTRLAGADPEGFFAYASLQASPGAYDKTFVQRYSPRVGEHYCTPTSNSTGLPALMEALGTTSLSLDHLLLASNQLPALQFGIFFYGPLRQEVPFGNGLLCVAPGTTGLGRLKVERANAAGRIVHLLDYDHPPSNSTRIDAGSTWHFQTWFRDPMGGGSAFDLSDGLTLVFAP
jgi:hypothetical protein